jgi:nitrilase
MERRLLTVAVVQAAALPFARDAGIDRACQLINEAAAQGAKLIVLPEVFITGYPRGLSFGAVVGNRTAEGRELYRQLWEQCVEVPSPATERLGEAARAAKAHVAIGVMERAGGSLFCSLLHFGEDGQLLLNHRKLKPTASERLLWGEGDGSTLKVLEAPIGRVGGLICWENYMPLARTALYAQGVELYCAPTADARESWQATLRHIACEGRCFVLGCNQFQTRSMYPAHLRELDELRALPEVICRGGSVIVSPFGEVVAGPIFDREEILCATIDLNDIPRAKFDFDVVGHYARPDIFTLTVNTNKRTPFTMRDEPEPS